MVERRRFLQAAMGFGAVAGISPALAATRRLVVMTSYPQEVISRYVDAFGRLYPGIRVDVVWHSGDDARDYLLGEGRGKVDVFWSPSVRTFFQLKKRGALRRLDIDRAGLPGRIGKQWVSDPDGYFEAVEVAGYGLVCNPDALTRLGLPMPAQWDDLARPDYAGHITMPVPSRIGFAPTITEIILQAYGWAAGWSLLARIAANAELQTLHSDDFLEPVISGRKAVGLTIDFFAAQAIARGAPLRFVYPKANAFEPANIAVPVAAPNRAAAMDYVRFVLSERGQRLLIDPDLRRLSVRPSVYADAPPDYFNPFAQADRSTFDDSLFVRRRDLDDALFDAVIKDQWQARAPLWAAIRRLDRATAPAAAKALVDEAQALLTAVPIDEATANALAETFSGRDLSPPAAKAKGEWSRRAAADTRKAAEALARAETMGGRP